MLSIGVFLGKVSALTLLDAARSELFGGIQFFYACTMELHKQVDRQHRVRLFIETDQRTDFFETLFRFIGLTFCVNSSPDILGLLLVVMDVA